MASTSAVISTPATGKRYLARYVGRKGSTPIYAMDCGSGQTGTRQLARYSGVKGSTPIYQVAHQNPPNGKYKAKYVGVKGGTPIYVLGECGGCALPACVSPFSLPTGAVTIKFKTTGGTHLLPEQTIAATFADSFAECCTETSNSLNTLVVGDTFTRQYTVNDQADSRLWYCAFPTSTRIKQMSYEVRREGASAYRVDYRYCNLLVSTCAAVEMIYGVATCGIRVTVSLQRKTGFDSVGVGWDARKGTIDFYTFAGVYISTLTEWVLCDGPSTPIVAWPASPTIPSVSPTVRTCADTFPDACTETRSVFIPSVTSLPPGAIVSLTAADTTTESPAGCSSVLSVFTPCPVVTVPRWTAGNDACGKPSYYPVTPPFVFENNFGYICDPDTSIGTCGPGEPDLISRTRTQSETLSHASGTYIVNLPGQTWTLTF